MQISVKAKPGAKKEFVEKMSEPDDGLFQAPGSKAALPRYVVSVKERAMDGRANDAIIKALAAHFKVPPSRVHIIRGHTAHLKTVEIL